MITCMITTLMLIEKYSNRPLHLDCQNVPPTLSYMADRLLQEEMQHFQEMCIPVSMQYV